MKGIAFYATVSGNTELVVEAVVSGLEEKSHSVKLERAELVKLTEESATEIATEYDFMLIASPTWNVGRLEMRFEKFFYPQFLKFINSNPEFKDFPVALIGLGDSENYDIYNGAADILEETIQQGVLTQLGPTLRVDGQPHKHLEQHARWGHLLADELANL